MKTSNISFLIAVLTLLISAVRSEATVYTGGVNTNAAGAADISILYIGNSMTYFWEMPGLSSLLGEEETPAVDIYAHRQTAGGWSLMGHYNDSLVHTRIRSWNWDAIVLQPYQNASQGSPTLLSDLSNAVPLLVDLVRSNNVNTKIYLYDHNLNTSLFYPAFTNVGHGTESYVVPAGHAWAQATNDFPGAPTNDWFWTDGGHPGRKTAYTVACLMYAMIANQSPEGIPLYSWTYGNPSDYGGSTTVTTAEAAYMQSNAWYHAVNYGYTPSPGTGYIAMTLSPTQAVALGAAWRFTSGIQTNWHTNETAGTLSGGNNITFNPVTGWLAPTDINLLVTTDETSTYARLYLEEGTGLVSCSLTPTGAVAAGAQWRLTGSSQTNWNDSDEVLTNEAGRFTLEFKGLAGWVAPDSTPVELSHGQHLSYTGACEEIIASDTNFLNNGDIELAAGFYASGYYNGDGSHENTWVHDFTRTLDGTNYIMQGAGTQGIIQYHNWAKVTSFGDFLRLKFDYYAPTGTLYCRVFGFNSTAWENVRTVPSGAETFLSATLTNHPGWSTAVFNFSVSNTYDYLLTQFYTDSAAGSRSIDNMELKPQSSGNDNPTPIIFFPTNGAVFTEGENVLCHATAWDLEDGMDITNYYWHTAAHGSLGGLTQFTTNLTELGTQALILQATDKDGGQGQTSVMITIVSNAPDFDPPVLSNVSFNSASELALTFSEALDPVTAQTLTNYSIDQGIIISNASLAARTVTLTLSPVTTGVVYQLTVNHMQDESSNVITQTSTGFYYSISCPELLFDGSFTNTTTAGDFTAGSSELGKWYSSARWSQSPTNGNPDAWYSFASWSGHNAVIGVPAPASGEDWTVTFDWILDRGSHYQDGFYVYGLSSGNTIGRTDSPTGWGGAALLSDASLGQTAAWTEKTYSLSVPGAYDVIAFIVRTGADGTGSIGIDNLAVTNCVLTTTGVSSGSNDQDNDGMDDSWEQQHFGDTATATTNSDHDADGMLDWQEFIAGTLPTNAGSIFSTQGIGGPGGQMISWAALTGRTYALYSGTNLPDINLLINSNITTAVNGSITYTDTVNTSERQVYYKLGVSK